MRRRSTCQAKTRVRCCLPPGHDYLIRTFAFIHEDCIETDSTLATFHPPFQHADTKTPDIRVLKWWYLQVARRNWQAIGSVEKLLVSPRYRRMGIAKRLMSKLEEVALLRGTTLLTLDTEAGSPAEGVYPRLGYTRLGLIPRYGLSPKDGRLVDEVFFYKDLRST
ncbi:hypothetical protein KCU81_g24, partial [Aureobasidium melanogenum]